MRKLISKYIKPNFSKVVVVYNTLQQGVVSGVLGLRIGAAPVER